MSNAIAGSNNNNAAIGFALFDMWMNGLKKSNKAKQAVGSPLLAAASAAFEQYVSTVEVQNAAMIDSVAQTALNPKSPVIYGVSANGINANPITSQEIAPFLALNVMA